MSSASLPPLPALIPIAVLRKSPLSNNNSEFSDENHRDCTTRLNRSKVINEQRPQRQAKEPLDVLIDNSRSRDSSAAPQSRKIGPERHRKSNRQRDRHRRAKTKSQSRNRNLSTDQPINPRVNPIFVWVRQEDTRIVEVKCEDYDKRNRILLTKTPQGWRATPRTETLVPTQKEEDDRKHQHHHRSKKSKRNKIKQKSTAVQVEDLPCENEYDVSEDPTMSKVQESHTDWESPVNVETLLPSHTIHVHRRDTHPMEESCSISDNVNSAVKESAQIDFKCSAEISPLDNLLAVAELEFNEQLQSGQWESSDQQTDDKTECDPPENIALTDEQSLSLIEDMEHLQNFIESCTQEDKLTEENAITTSQKEECDYTEDEENNLAMNDILSRLEQSLRSPDIPEIEQSQCDTKETGEEEILQPNEFNEEETNNCDNLIDEPSSVICLETADSDECKKELDNTITEEPKQEQPTDLSLKTMRDLTIEIPPRNDYFEQPTDLSIPKQNKLTQSNISTYRPPSQNSDALQSPQPSGLPAILPSPGIVSPGNLFNISSNSKDKPSSLETSIQTNSEEILNHESPNQSQPLDLEKCRKSASPTVTCSEEVNNQRKEDEPPLKKHKTSESSNLSDVPTIESKKDGKIIQLPKQPSDITNTLAEPVSEITPIMQLHQLLLDETLNIPDPMLVPKKILKKIIASPGTEIPDLLKNRPELRLPEALEFPHLLQDPDILVITIQQLEEIVKQQSPTKKKPQQPNEKKSSRTSDKESMWEKGASEIEEQIRTGNFMENKEGKSLNDYNDIEMASNAALNQLLWLPYMNQFEALQLRNSELMMALANSNINRTMPHPTNLSHLMSNSGFPSVPGNFKMPSYSNPFEMNLWQGSLLQPGLLGQKNPSNNFEMRNSFKDLMRRTNYEDINRKYMHNQKYSMENKYAMHNQFFQPPQAITNLSNPYMNQSQVCQGNIKSRMPSVSHSSSSSQRNTNSQNSKVNYPHRQAVHEKPYSQGPIRMKPVHKLMNSGKHHQKMESYGHMMHGKEKHAEGKTGHHTSQPIDLSGASSTQGGKAEMMRHQQPLIDSLNHLKYSRTEDVGEVGSTTASIEEMQEAHKHLWHPLFGTDKCHNGWNLPPSMTISSE